MRSTTMLMTCRFLIVALLTLSFQTARAGMIGAEQAAPQTDRGTVLSVLDRAETVSQLQSYGIDPTLAKQRVAAMTDQELRTLTSAIDVAPAGASSGTTIVVVLVIAALVWYFAFRR